MGITERRQRQKEEVRNGILQAARQMVQEEGWQSLSIRKIADAIEYSVPVIYDHFENKDAIMAEFMREGFDMLGKDVDAAKAKHEAPTDQLHAIARAYWNFALNNKEYYQVMFGLGMPQCETVRTVPEVMHFTSTVLTTVTEAIKSGKNPDADAFLKYRTFWSMLHGLTSIIIMKNAPENIDEHHNDDMDKLILEDAIAGFIKALRE